MKRTARVAVGLLAVVFSIASAVGLRAEQENVDRVSLDGTVLVKAADARRVVVAISSSSGDQSPLKLVDHVFLFTSWEAFQLPPTTLGHAHVEFRDNALTIAFNGGQQILEFAIKGRSQQSVKRPDAIRFENGQGLSHYTGWSQSGFRLTDIDGIRPSPACASCFDANGHTLQFPM